MFSVTLIAPVDALVKAIPAEVCVPLKKEDPNADKKKKKKKDEEEEEEDPDRAVKENLRNYNGQIAVQSVLGKGTTFTIRLPVAQM